MSKLFLVKIEKQMIIEASSIEDAESKYPHYIGCADGSEEVSSIENLIDVKMAGFSDDFGPVNNDNLTIAEILSGEY